MRREQRCFQLSLQKSTPSWRLACLIGLVLLLALGGAPVGAQTRDYAYVVLKDNFSEGTDEIAVIDTVTHAVVATIRVSDPRDVTFTPDRARAYVTSFLSETVAVIDTASDTVTATVAVGAGPNG